MRHNLAALRTFRSLVAALVVVALAAPAAQGRARYVFTVAGDGASGFGGDGGPATRAALNLPRSVSTVPGGGFLVAEADNNTVRRVTADGTIRTVAGTGDEDYAGDGGPATRATLDFTHDVAALPHGGFLIADMNNRRIRRVSRSGRIGTVAGNGNPGARGDGGPATRAQLNYPHAVAPLRGGGFLIADTENDEVRRVLRSGRIVRVAGTGVRGYGGDGGRATGAQLDQPFDVAPLHDGGFLIADAGNDVIRKVSPSGRITTVAGTGVAGSGGDGGRATMAQLDRPHSVASLPGGGFLIADTENHRIRLVRRGRMTTVAGTGLPGYGGDGGRAVVASFDEPKAVEPTSGGGFLVADSGNDRVRMVSVVGPRPLAVSFGGRRGARRPPRVRYRWDPLTALEGGDTRLAFRTAARSRARLALHRLGGAPAATVELAARTGRNAVVLPPTVVPGRYRATLTARTVDGQRASARATVTVLAPPAAPSVPTASGSDADGPRPAALVLGGVGLALIGAGAMVYRRHRRLVRREAERRARRRLRPDP